MKKKFPCLSKKIHYQPDLVCKVIKACACLWNIGLLSGDNKGYDPDEYVIPDKDELQEDLGSTSGGRVMRNPMCKYLWEHHIKFS